MSSPDTGNMWVLYLFEGDGSLGAYGHVSLAMPNTDTYISFYPEGKKSNGKSSSGSSASTARLIMGCAGSFFESYRKEQDCYKREAKHLLIYGLNSEKMVKWWKAFKENLPPFHVSLNNCAVVVYQALCEGNEWFKNDEHAKTPQNVFKLVEAYNRNNTTHKRCKGCCCFPFHCIGSSFSCSLGCCCLCGICLSPKKSSQNKDQQAER